jgi:hypothetical protein
MLTMCKNGFVQFILESSGGPLFLNDFSQPPGNQLRQLLQAGTVAHLGHPQHDDLALPPLRVGAGGLPELELHPGPRLTPLKLNGHLFFLL